MNEALAKYFEVDESLFDEIDIEFHENTGSSGDMTYNYYFYVPENCPEETLDVLQWEIGETIELPLGWDEYDQHHLEAEEEWLKHNPLAFRFAIFKNNLDLLRRIIKNNEANFFDRHLVSKMAYSYSISLMEGYLSDTARQMILHNEKITKNALNKYGNEKIPLSRIFYLGTDCVKHELLKKVSSTTWHNISQIGDLFSVLIGKQFEFCELKKIIDTRHDIVHRDGKTINGDELNITSSDALKAIDTIYKVISRLNDSLVALSID